MVGLGLPEMEFGAVVEVASPVISVEKGCCSDGDTEGHGGAGTEAGRVEEAMLSFVSVSSSWLACGARLGSAGLVHCNDWVCACRWGQGILRRTMG